MAKKGYMDLRSSADLPKFNKLIDSAAKKGIFILVHADFCGPCQNYKKEIWNDLVEKKDRKAELAAIHYDQLENSPFSDAKIKGYPSVLYVSKNGSVKRVTNFNDSDGMTNAMPSADMRNKELMNKLVNAEPKEINKILPNIVEEPVESDSDSSSDEPEFDAETTALRNSMSAEKAVENIKNRKSTKDKGSPPKVNTDVLDSQEESPVMDFNPNETENTPKTKGGSLYSALLNVARQKARNNTKKKSKKRGTKTRSK